MNAPLYTPDILRLAASLEAPRQLERVDGRAELRSPTCGSTIVTAVTVDEAGRVTDISQTVSACAFGQAAAALVERAAPGRSADQLGGALDALSDWLAGKRDDPGDWPGVAVLAPARSKTGRHGAILLPFRALLRAMGNS